MQVREGLLQDTVRQVTARGERRARLLQAVTEKAEEQARVWRDYHRLARDNTQLRRDLQVLTLNQTLLSVQCRLFISSGTHAFTAQVVHAP